MGSSVAKSIMLGSGNHTFVYYLDVNALFCPQLTLIMATTQSSSGTTAYLIQHLFHHNGPRYLSTDLALCLPVSTSDHNVLLSPTTWSRTDTLPCNKCPLNDTTHTKVPATNTSPSPAHMRTLQMYGLGKSTSHCGAYLQTSPALAIDQEEAFLLSATTFRNFCAFTSLHPTSGYHYRSHGIPILQRSRSGTPAAKRKLWHVALISLPMNMPPFSVR